MSKDKNKLANVRRETEELTRAISAEVRGVSEDVQRLRSEVDSLRYSMVATSERVRSSEHLEQLIWSVWGTVSANRDSLNSAKVCRSIRELAEAVVSGVQEQLEECRVESLRRSVLHNKVRESQAKKIMALEAELSAKRDELKKTKRKLSYCDEQRSRLAERLGRLERKVAHGCVDATCVACDGSAG